MSIWDLTEEDKKNMRTAGWSDKAMELFGRREKLGELEGANVCHTGRTEHGEGIRFCIRVEEGRIVDARYSYQGCPALAATGAAILEVTLNRTVEEAEASTGSDVWSILWGLPEGHDEQVEFVLRTFKETLRIYRGQRRLTKGQHDGYLHFCGLA